ncbi:MAG: crossover junction endodeoxyribonuclease RuvC [Helicobacteraceae bacterium]|jgi:crossover junction endodeoxyribonuclease RuvC|nr:crossover junction endodeoxyribonuclease RuvC [Helicobacteraceae bacterium]
MIILGIDPGSAKCGYALLELQNRKMILLEAGFFKIASAPLVEQLPELIEGLDLVLKKTKIDEAAVEDVFFAYNPKSVLKLAQFRGAILLRLIQEVGVIHEYTPLQVKKSVTGKAKAAKEQVAYMVKTILGIKSDIKPLDITDAIAVAIAHAQRVMIRR